MAWTIDPTTGKVIEIPDRPGALPAQPASPSMAAFAARASPALPQAPAHPNLTGPSPYGHPLPDFMSPDYGSATEQDPAAGLRMLNELRGGESLFGGGFRPRSPLEEDYHEGAEAGVAEGEAQGALAMEEGGLPEITGEGDLPRAKRRREVEERIAQLANMRDMAEGMGRGVLVAGDIRRGRKESDVAYRPQGLRDLLETEQMKLGQLGVEDQIRLKAELEGGGGPGLGVYETKARDILNKAALEFRKPTARIAKIQDSIADSEQINDLLSGETVTETDFQQALTLVIKSMGREVGNIAEKERRNYADLVGVPGMFRKGYRWAMGGPSPGQVKSVLRVAQLMAGNLAKRGRLEIKIQTRAMWQRNQPIFEGAGIAQEDLTDQLGLSIPELPGGDGAPEEPVMMELGGEIAPIHASQVNRFIMDNPDATRVQ